MLKVFESPLVVACLILALICYGLFQMFPDDVWGMWRFFVNQLEWNVRRFLSSFYY
jgi:hypothetical protein